MVRFESVDDPGFNAVVGELCRWVKQIGQRPSIDKSDLGEFKGQNRKDKHTGYCACGNRINLARQLTKIVIVPYPSNPDFVGRSDIVETLKSQLKYGPQLGGGTSQSRAALFGLGGIGYDCSQYPEYGSITDGLTVERLKSPWRTPIGCKRDFRVCLYFGFMLAHRNGLFKRFPRWLQDVVFQRTIIPRRTCPS